MRARSRRERGSVLVWTVLWLGALIALLALVINVGHSMTARGELQNAVDAAALAAARQLDGTAAELGPARACASDYARAHPTDRYAVEAKTTWFGAWTPIARGCDPDDLPPDPSTQPGLVTATHMFCRVTDGDAAAAFRVNAVYVQAERAGIPGGPGGGAIPAVLHPFLRSGATMTRTASAVAVTGGPTATASACIPMVIGVGCLTTDPEGGDGGFVCDTDAPPDTPGPMYVLGLSATGVRSAGWSVFSDTAPSDSEVCDYLQAGCQPLSMGDVVQIDIGQGNKFNGGCAGSPDAEGASKVCDWFKQFARKGEHVDVPVISESGDLSEPCPSTYTGQAWIVGFVTLKVLAVNCSTHTGGGTRAECVDAPGTAYCADATAPCSQYASDKCIVAQQLCNHDGGTRSTGGAWTGTSPLKPILVK